MTDAMQTLRNALNDPDVSDELKDAIGAMFVTKSRANCYEASERGVQSWEVYDGRTLVGVYSDRSEGEAVAEALNG